MAEPGTYWYYDKGCKTGWNVSPLIQEVDGTDFSYPYVWWSA